VSSLSRVERGELRAFAVTTAIFSTCGMSIWVFCVAAFLSLPKQFVTVYLGVILEQASDGGKVDFKTRIAEYSVVAVTVSVTFLAMWYILDRSNKVKPAVIYERRKRRLVTIPGFCIRK
jgi:uncharacterized membrane protein YdjX (TVP38/TMEM64 family)